LDLPTITVPLLWQLGINQSFLLKATIDVYSQKISQLFLSFEKMFHENEIVMFGMEFPIYSSLKIKNYENCRKLSNIIHHYCHAIEYLHSHSVSPSFDAPDDAGGGAGGTSFSVTSDGSQLPSLRETKELRKRLYSILKRNVDFLFLQKNLSKEEMLLITTTTTATPAVGRGLFSSDELETIKAVIVAGQHLLHDSLTLSIDDRINLIIPQLLEYLQLLFPYIHPLQRSSLEMIQGTLFIEKSILFVNSQNYENALESIETALKILNRLADSSGNHILLHPLLMKGNILSLLKRYKETFILYDRCLEIINSFDSQKEKVKEKEKETTWNQFFEFRLQIYYNYGLALEEFQSNDSLQGKHFFEQALALLRHYHSIKEDADIGYCVHISNPEHQTICWNIYRHL
jgi:tetratricopeptide (TPR) repeat protein